MKFKNKVGGAILGALLCATISGISATATYLRYDINFTHYPQEKTNWCWAACATAAGKHVTPSSPYNQYDAVYSVHNNYANSGGTVAETASAANFVSQSNATYTGCDYAIGSEVLVQKILQDRVTIIGYARYTPNNVYDSAHMVTATKYEVETSVNHRVITVYDPYLDSEVVYNYTQLYQGSYPENGLYLKMTEHCKY